MLQWLRKLTGKAANMTALPSGIPLHKFTDYESYLVAGSRKVWASWKACDLTAKVVMDTPFAVVNARGDTMDNPPADLARLLQYPSEDETFSDLVYVTIMHLKLTGNAFWFKSEARRDGSRPMELININPKRMKIVPGKERKVAGYVLTCGNGGKDIPFQPEEIMHFRIPHPNNEYWGLGDIEASEELFNGAINRNEWDKQFWKNGASPSGILSTKQVVMDQKDFDRVKAKWQKEYGGLENSGRTAFLTGDWTYQQLGLTAVEMQDMEKSKVTVENIVTAHGVPLSVMGLRDAANYATAEIDDMRFRRYTVKPLVKIVQDTVNTDLVAGWGLSIAWEIAGLIPISHVMASYTPLFDRGGLTINELREKAGLPIDKANPLWEQTFISAGLLPLELAGISDFGQAQQQAQASVSRFIDAKMQDDLKRDGQVAKAVEDANTKAVEVMSQVADRFRASSDAVTQAIKGIKIDVPAITLNASPVNVSIKEPQAPTAPNINLAVELKPELVKAAKRTITESTGPDGKKKWSVE